MQENRVITALDFPNQETCLRFLEAFPEPIFVKIGMELFYSAGPDCVRKIKALGHQVFLDLKFHDIPNTVAGAVRSCAGLGADILNVHAAGGIPMMRGAMEELKASGAATKLIAITQLTSTSPEQLKQELWIDHPMEETVLHYASITKEAGLDGVVCSAQEVQRLHKELGNDFLTVTPGIRPADAAKGDQQRVVTPFDAGKLGSDYIVVGRPITKAADPYAAYVQIRKDFEEGRKNR